MLLRRFYIQENQKGETLSVFANGRLNILEAPDPQVKRSRELNTEILPFLMDTPAVEPLK